MKVILKDDIKNLGNCGEVVEVKGGYARNYLIPRNLAVQASTGNLKSIDEIKKQKLDTKIIFISAYSDSGKTKERLMNEGAYAFLEKPITSLKELEDLVNEAAVSGE